MASGAKRRARKDAADDDEAEEFPLLDSAEQEKVVKEMEAQQMRGARWWRAAFGVLAAAIGSLYAYLSLRQILEPWGLRHHAMFSGAVHKHAVAAADATAAACLYAVSAAYAVRFQRTRPDRTGAVWRPVDIWMVRAALASGAALCLFWTIALSRMDEMALELVWMPVAVPGYVLMTLHVEHTIEHVGEEVQALRGKMYKHASA